MLPHFQGCCTQHVGSPLLFVPKRFVTILAGLGSLQPHLASAVGILVSHRFSRLRHVALKVAGILLPLGDVAFVLDFVRIGVHGQRQDCQCGGVQTVCFGFLQSADGTADLTVAGVDLFHHRVQTDEFVPSVLGSCVPGPFTFHRAVGCLESF